MDQSGCCEGAGSAEARWGWSGVASRRRGRVHVIGEVGR